MQSYNGTDFKNCLLKAFHISPDANEFTFENPNGKVYCGNFETLTVNFYSIENDTVITSFNTVINEALASTPSLPTSTHVFGWNLFMAVFNDHFVFVTHNIPYTIGQTFLVPPSTLSLV